MPIKFTKAVASKPAAAHTATVEQHPKVASFFKRGAEAREALAAEEAKAEIRRQEGGKMFRFYVEPGQEKQITFLDGKLDDSGMLDIYVFYEHTLQVNGQWMNFVCTAEIDQTQPCPICERGERASLVGVMTVIDHTPITLKKGPNAGQTLQHVRRLFVAKRQTLTQLTTLAKKRGGLVGCTFDVSRIGDTAARVGSQFDFQHKFSTRKEIMEACGLTDEQDVMPADYEKEIRYYSPQELIELGVGKAPVGIGYTKKAAASYSDEL